MCNIKKTEWMILKEKNILQNNKQGAIIYF